MSEIASSWVSILPTAKGFGRSLTKQVGPDVDRAGRTVGGTFGRRFGEGFYRDANGRLRDTVTNRFVKESEVGGDLAGQRFSTGFGGRLATFGRSAREFGAKAGRAFAAGFTIGAVAVGGFLKSSISAAGDLEQSVGAVDTVFKRSAGQMHRWGKNASQAVGLTRNEFNELGTLIGSQLKNGGTAMDQLAPKTRNLITLGADLSSMFGGTTKEAVEALSSALKGERDPIERYGVTLNQSKIDAEAAALGYKKVGNAFDNQAQQAATLSLIYKQTADAQGNFAKESNTLSGQQQRLSAQWGDMKARLGTALLPVASRFVSFLNRSMEPTIARIRNGFRLFIDRTEGVRTAMREALLPVVQRVTKFLKENPAVIKGAAIALGVLAVAVGVVALAMGALSVATSPITAVILLVAGLGAGIAYLWKNSETFRNVVTKVGQVLVQLGGWIRANVIPAIVDLGQKVATNLRPIWNALVEFFRGTVVPLLGQVADKFREWWPTIQRVGLIVAGLIAKWVEFYTAIQGKVIPIVLKVAGFLLRTLVPAVLGGIGVIVKIVAKVIAFGAAVVNAGKKVADFATKVKAKIDQVLSWIGGLPQKAKDKLGDLSGILLDAGKQVINGLWNGMKEVWKDVEGWLGDVTDMIPIKKGPPKKDGKLLTPAGRLIMQGLIRGLESQRLPLERLLTNVTKQIGNALKHKKISKTAARQMREIVNAVAAEGNKLKAILNSRSELASSIAGGLKSEFDLSAITAPNEFGLSQGPAAAVKAAQGIVARMRAFAAKLASLLKAGMPTALVQEIAGYGSVEGTRVADVFLKASKSQMASIRSSYAGVQKYANAAGAVIASATYAKDIADQRALLDKIPDAIAKGLKSGRFSLVIGRRELARLRLEMEAAHRAQK